MTGRVYLVGAGPGDPRLITLRAVECLRRADVVLYDALANPRLLRYAPAHAERRLVGKRHGRTSVAQDRIETMLVEYARRGLEVVRLKGGDPFVFGRGGEEAEACRAAGVPFEVVPGVTSATAVPTYAGIPLTHREHSSLVTFVTGRSGDAKADDALDWEALARTGGTLVFLMATLRARAIADSLMKAGLPPQTPVAAVRWGTTPRQKTLRASLSDFGSRIEAARLRPPVVMVVGAVAALADTIAWYESLPLFGKRIVVTRARHQADDLSVLLECQGADVVEFPVIEIVDPDDRSEIDAAYERIGSYDWLLLTSVNGVERFLGGLLAAGHDIRELAGVAIAAIGPATGEAVRRYGLHVAAQPTEFRAEALIDALGEVRGRRMLIARAAVARDVLPDELRRRGAFVDVVPVYRTVLPAHLPDAGELGDFDVVTFTSSSTVTNFVRIVGERIAQLLQGKVVAAIGPITAKALEDAGLSCHVMPTDYTVPALADAIVGYFANRNSVK